MSVKSTGEQAISMSVKSTGEQAVSMSVKSTGEQAVSMSVKSTGEQSVCRECHQISVYRVRGLVVSRRVTSHVSHAFHPTGRHFLFLPKGSGPLRMEEDEEQSTQRLTSRDVLHRVRQ